MFVDPHTHHYLSNYSTLELLKREGIEAVGIMAYFPVKPSSHITLIDLFRWLLTVERERFSSVGIKLFVGVGIHPRNIPDSGLEELLKVIDKYIEEADAIGEVGLELSTDVEIYVLRKMIEFSEKMDKPIVIHTPRKEKATALRKIASVLREGRVSQEIVLVDHASMDLIKEFIDLGTYIGLTVQSGKLSPEQVVEIVKRYPEVIDRAVVNSDCGSAPSDPLAVKKVYEALRREGISNSDALKLVRDNAIKFFRS